MAKIEKGGLGMKGKIFNAQEVQGILNGSKVMFREVMKPQIPDNPTSLSGKCWGDCFFGTKKAGFYYCSVKCPYQYQVGQKIFCKESFFINSFNERMFKATFDYCSKRFSRLKDLYHDKSAKWKPAQHMKQEQSRLTLLIKEIKVEKLADITPFDCVCEGIWDGRNVALGMSGKAVEAFKDNWNATHKKPEEKFKSNPWVWSILFEVENERN